MPIVGMSVWLAWLQVNEHSAVDTKETAAVSNSDTSFEKIVAGEEAQAKLNVV